MERDSLLKRAGIVLLGVLFALVLAESVLQVAALVARKQARPSEGETAGAGGPVVLCVGDSFTYGSGSSSPATAYPGALQTWLRAHDPARAEWHVRNAGWPGRNSSEVVRRLPGFLAEARPAWVCVLIGLNNRWSEQDSDLPLPEPGEALATTGSESGWKWRLPRLIALAGAAFRERWGRDAGIRDAGPAPSESSAVVTAPDSIDPSDPIAALDVIRARRTDAADVRPLLEALESIRPRIREMNDPEAAAALVLLLGDMSRYRDAEEEGRIAVEKYGMTPSLANALVRPLGRLNRADEAIELARIALAAAPADLERRRRLGNAYRMARRDDEALTELTRVFVATGRREEYEKLLRKLDPDLIDSPERWARALDGVEMSPEAREEVEACREVVRTEDKSAPQGDVLRRDLDRMRELVEASGARMVVLTYPLGYGQLSATLRTFAQENDLPLADVEPTFRELVMAGKRDEYFIPDLHCNDSGYAILAEHVGRLLLGNGLGEGAGKS